MTTILGAALFIFVLRVIGVSLSTIRVLIMMRGKKLLSASVGFFEVMVYAIAIGQVVQNLSNWWNLLGYCLGFAVGTLLGIWLEERIALGYTTIRVVSAERAHAIAEAVRRAGHGATEMWGEGKKGQVGMVKAVVKRKEAEPLCQLIDRIDPEAFITIEETRAVQHGYLRAARHAR